MIEQIIVITAIICAAVFLFLVFRKSVKTGSCPGCSESGCSTCPEKPPAKKEQ